MRDPINNIIDNHFLNKAKPIGFRSFDSYKNVKYGKIDHNNNQVILNNSFLVNINDYKTDANVIDFVADAYYELISYIRQHIKKFGTMKNDVLLELELKTCYVNPILFYHTSLYKLIESLFLGIYNKNYEINDINDVINYCCIYLRDIGITKFNLSTWLLSSACPLETSGLVINLKSPNPANMSNKSYFYTRNNLNFYFNAVNYHGFYFDINNPWRIIANISSAAMQRYMKGRGVGFETFFQQRYIKVSSVELDNVKAVFTDIYNRWMKKNRYLTGIQDFVDVRSDVLSDDEWTKVLIRTKALEYNQPLKPKDIDNLMKDSLVWEINGGDRMYYLANYMRNAWSL